MLILVACRSPHPAGAEPEIAPPTAKIRIPVLVYHRITDNKTRGDIERISISQLQNQIEYLRQKNYTTLSLDEVVEFTRSGHVPTLTKEAKFVVLTFDDGWRSQNLAVPLLEKNGMKAAFFLFPGKGISDPHGDYLRWDEVTAIAANPSFTIASHSMSHPWDPKSNLVTWVNGRNPPRGHDDVIWELTESKRILESRLNTKIRYFGWPAGWYNQALIDHAKDSGYAALFTIDPGFVEAGADPSRIKRLMVDGACSLSDFQTLLEGQQIPACQKKAMAKVRQPD